MLETVDPKLLAMPTDDELYSVFFEAAVEWAHDNIKWLVGKIGNFLKDAKTEVKNLMVFDPEKWLSIKLDMETGNALLSWFINKQPLLKKWLLLALLTPFGASSFDTYVAKMNQTEDNINTCNTTLPRILILFMQKLSVKYVVNETEEHIKGMVSAIFHA